MSCCLSNAVAWRNSPSDRLRLQLQHEPKDEMVSIAAFVSDGTAKRERIPVDVSSLDPGCAIDPWTIRLRANFLVCSLNLLLGRDL